MPPVCHSRRRQSISAAFEKEPATARLPACLPAEPMTIGGGIQRSSRICLECSLPARVVTESLHATAPLLVRIQMDDTRSSPARPGRGRVPHWTALAGREETADGISRTSQYDGGAATSAVIWRGLANLADAVGNGSSQLRPLIPRRAEDQRGRETTLEALGCRFTLAADKAEYHSDGSPVLQLEPRIDRSARRARLRLQILAALPMARITAARNRWSQDCTGSTSTERMKLLTIVANGKQPPMRS